METKEFAGKRVVVMGLGRFGGGIAAARWLVGQGARVTVTDLAPAKDLAESVSELDGLPIQYRLGGHNPADLDGCEMLVVSPAVPKDRSDFVTRAKAKGVRISSEMNLFAERCPARRIIGITGSAGKSTTTAMIGSILQAACPASGPGRAWMGGNIGHSLLPNLTEMSPEDVVVLELSSFQLEDLGSIRWSPNFALITNLQPNHLDRHGTFEAYADAKLNIVRFQRPSDAVFVHARDEATAKRVRDAGGGERLKRFEFDAAFADALRVPGSHNRGNAAAAIAVARAVGIGDEEIRAGLAAFTGLPHRLELVGEFGGVRYFNDSKATTSESARIALEAFDEPVIMLVGGRGKGAPFTELARAMAKKAKGVVCYGETQGEFLRELGAADAASRQARVASADSFEHAVALGRQMAAPGDVVVLSPACTSYDMFKNYEQRGETFRQIVRRLG
jgi:UDP-N-acetylmuramoylalanine--D-glutamate ligase